MEAKFICLSVVLALSGPAVASICAPLAGCVPVAPKYRVVLDNCGPGVAPLRVINAPHQQAPTIEKPVINLPAYIPAPKTVNHVAHVTKTVVKPQVYQQLITVPAVQRYLQTLHTPVVENIQYEGVPVNCPPYGPEAPAPAYIPSPLALPPSAYIAGLAGASAYLPGALAGLSGYLPSAGYPGCLPAAGLAACLPAPALPACLPAPALPACLPAPVLPACLPAPALPACLPALPACY